MFQPLGIDFDDFVGFILRQKQVQDNCRNAAGGNGVLEQDRQVFKHFRFKRHAQAQTDRRCRNHRLAPADTVADQNPHARNRNQAEHQNHRPT